MIITTNLTREISIHALRGEGDNSAEAHLLERSRFQSTPSVGRATAAIVFDSSIQAFQSTPSVGRATTPRQIDMILRRISIHALRGEGDIDSAKKPLRN